jgi:hypothetical protein
MQGCVSGDRISVAPLGTLWGVLKCYISVTCVDQVFDSKDEKSLIRFNEQQKAGSWCGDSFGVLLEGSWSNPSSTHFCGSFAFFPEAGILGKKLLTLGVNLLPLFHRTICIVVWCSVT